MLRQSDSQLSRTVFRDRQAPEGAQGDRKALPTNLQGTSACSHQHPASADCAGLRQADVRHSSAGQAQRLSPGTVSAGAAQGQRSTAPRHGPGRTRTLPAALCRPSEGRGALKAPLQRQAAPRGRPTATPGPPAGHSKRPAQGRAAAGSPHGAAAAPPPPARGSPLPAAGRWKPMMRLIRSSEFISSFLRRSSARRWEAESPAGSAEGAALAPAPPPPSIAGSTMGPPRGAQAQRRRLRPLKPLPTS